MKLVLGSTFGFIPTKIGFEIFSLKISPNKMSLN